MTNFQQTARDLAQGYAQSAQSGPYAKVYANAFSGANKSRGKSKTTPEDCARVMLQAIEAARPKARYEVTGLAKFAAWGKRLMSDRAVDAFLRRKFGIARA